MEQNVNNLPVQGDNFIQVPLHPKRIDAMKEWLEENELLIEGTDIVQVTFHVKRILDKNGKRIRDDVQGTILQHPKKKNE